MGYRPNVYKGYVHHVQCQVSFGLKVVFRQSFGDLKKGNSRPAFVKCTCEKITSVSKS